MISRKDLTFIRLLRKKKYRLQENKFIVEGIKNVNELLKSDFKVDLLLSTPESSKYFKGFSPEIISSDILTSVSSFSTNETCLAVANMKSFFMENMKKDMPIIVLDGVADPGNLGTIIRTLDWFGLKQIVCSDDCADFYNPKTISASMGSFTKIDSYYLNLPEFLNTITAPIYGLTLDGDHLNTAPMDKKGVYVFGSESHGIRKEVQPYINQNLTITKYGNAESLNVSIATGILLYQLSLP